VSTQELTLVEEAVKTKLILDSVDAWLLAQPSLINKRNRSMLPVVKDRLSLVNTLRGLLSDLGLKRRGQTVPSVAEYLASKTANGNTTPERTAGAQSDEHTKGDVPCATPTRSR
jgi:hypothetical protein